MATNNGTTLISQQQHAVKLCENKLTTLVHLNLTLNETINYWYKQNFKQHPVRTLLQKGPFYWTKIFYRRIIYLSKKYVLFTDDSILEKEEHIVSAGQDIRYTILVLQKWLKLNSELIGLLSRIMSEKDQALATHLLSDVILFFNKNKDHYDKSPLVASNGVIMVNQLGRLIDEHIGQIYYHVLPVYKQPNHFYRNWIKYTFFLSLGGYLAYKTFTNRSEISNWAHESFETAKRFSYQHLEEPIINMYNVIRYDKHRQLMDPQSLQVSVDSLERMVTKYATDHGIDGKAVTSDVLMEIAKQARTGNLEYIMHHYEDQMLKPIKNALFGDMAQLLLIQVQKQKVDVERTMVAMDKLMQTNELNFELMATLPAVLAVSAILYNVFTYRRKTDLRVFRTFKANLQVVERMLNRLPPNEQGTNEGEVASSVAVASEDIEEASDKYNYNQVCGFVYTHVWAMKLLLESNPHKFQFHYRSDESIARDLSFDLKELENCDLTSDQRIRTIERMYRSYRFLSPDFLSEQ